MTNLLIKSGSGTAYARITTIFFCNDTATTEIYTLSLHDALPISSLVPARRAGRDPDVRAAESTGPTRGEDQRPSVARQTRLLLGRRRVQWSPEVRRRRRADLHDDIRYTAPSGRGSPPRRAWRPGPRSFTVPAGATMTCPLVR